MSTEATRKLEVKPPLKQITYGDGYFFAHAGFMIATLSIPFQATYVPIVAVVLTILGLLRAQWQALLIMSFPIYGLAGALYSNALIANGGYITEQFIYGERSAATATLSMFTCAFLTLGHFSIASLTRRYFGKGPLADPSQKKMRRVVQGSLVIALLAYVGTLLLAGSGWSLAGARFEFWSSLPPLISPIMKLIHWYALPSLYALSAFYIFVYKRNAKGIATLLLIAPFLVFATGEKMSGLLVLATFFAAGIGLAGIFTGSRKTITKRLIVWVPLLAGALVLTTALGYKVAGAEDPFQAIDTRVILQGHVWYGIFQLADIGPLVPVGELINQDTLANPSGLNRISFLISPQEFLWPRLVAGISFTMGGPSVSIVAFGLIAGFLVWVTSAILYGISAWAALHFIARGKYVFAGVALGYVFTLNQVTMMGNWEFLYHPIAIVYYFVLLIAIFSPKQRSGAVTHAPEHVSISL